MEVRSSYPKPEYRDVISRIEILDVKNGERRVMQEFDYLVEAPNWSPDGKSLVYNRWSLLHSSAKAVSIRKL